MNERLDLLEKTILDLGTEVYKLRHALVHSSLKQQAVLKFLDGLKLMLQEKGYLSSDEIDEASIFADMLKMDAQPSAQEGSEVDPLDGDILLRKTQRKDISN